MGRGPEGQNLLTLPVGVTGPGGEDSQVGDEKQIEKELERAGFVLFPEDAVGEGALSLSFGLELSHRLGPYHLALTTHFFVANPF